MRTQRSTRVACFAPACSAAVIKISFLPIYPPGPSQMQYVARQPIVDAHRRLVAYELLFRNSELNYCAEADLDLASRKTIDAAFLLGLEALAGSHTIFLNCTYSLIVDKFPTLFPPQRTVIEVLESVNVDSNLISACAELKQAGYCIALDDFTPAPRWEPLLELANIVKIDLRATSLTQCEALSSQLRSKGKQLLAEKVETSEEFAATQHLGFVFFQGYFFSRPNIVSTHGVGGLDANQVRIFNLLSKSSLDFGEVEVLVKSDPAICYRLLRLLNSPVFCFRSEIHSVREALTMLGETEIRKWLLLLCAVLSRISPEKEHLLEASLVRARFAESVGRLSGFPGSELFLLGLLSYMDTILDLPFGTVACQLPLSAQLQAALSGLDNPLKSCFEIVLSYEQADWQRCDELRTLWKISPHCISRAYTDAVRWAHSACQ